LLPLRTRRALITSLFACLISHQPVILFSQNKPAISNQPPVLFSQNKPAPAISHQPNDRLQLAAGPHLPDRPAGQPTGWWSLDNNVGGGCMLRA
jgi:hypothetical protein